MPPGLNHEVCLFPDQLHDSALLKFGAQNGAKQTEIELLAFVRQQTHADVHNKSVDQQMSRKQLGLKGKVEMGPAEHFEQIAKPGELALAIRNPLIVYTVTGQIGVACARCASELGWMKGHGLVAIGVSLVNKVQSVPGRVAVEKQTGSRKAVNQVALSVAAAAISKRRLQDVPLHIEPILEQESGGQLEEAKVD